MLTVVILNGANGIYQNSLYGLVSAFPQQFTNAIVLGNNLCGTFVSVISIFTLIGEIFEFRDAELEIIESSILIKLRLIQITHPQCVFQLRCFEGFRFHEGVRRFWTSTSSNRWMTFKCDE
uniref:Uncharacterized protein n=1 Tax=Parascaris equorum TaxID=6256 RepID=A0A914RL75_PAREQ